MSISDNGQPVYGKDVLAFGRTTVATAGTEQSLATNNSNATGVFIKALAGNTGIVYIGDSTVTSSNGYELSAGEEIFLPIANTAAIYVDAATNGDGVCYFIV